MQEDILFFLCRRESVKYPYAMKRGERDWDVIMPIFKFSVDVRTIIYTTNAFENLNSTYRKLNRLRSVFPSSPALLKALYLATFEATKNGVCCPETRAELMGNLLSYTKTDFQNNLKRTA